MADGTAVGDHGPNTLWHGDNNFFQIAEAGARWSFDHDALPGRLAVGVTYDNARLDRFRGGRQNGAASVYGVLEQKLWRPAEAKPNSDDAAKGNGEAGNDDRPGDDRGVYAFAQYGVADEEVSLFHQHASLGVTWVGPYRAAYLDTMGVAFSTVWFSDTRGTRFTQDAETAVELFYNYQVLSYLSVKPDLQYVIHPGGDADLRDALVATLRVTVAF